jgi:hypothetical protein
MTGYCIVSINLAVNGALFKFRLKEVVTLGQFIEYEKVMTEIVYINLPGPKEPAPRMSGPELLHGFLADIYRAENPE